MHSLNNERRGKQKGDVRCSPPAQAAQSCYATQNGFVAITYAAIDTTGPCQFQAWDCALFQHLRRGLGEGSDEGWGERFGVRGLGMRLGVRGLGWVKVDEGWMRVQVRVAVRSISMASSPAGRP